ncbi:MAG: GxxExxY protein [Chloroflexi bacterium]|nr:GxxExxY protein [Chloroflexota bacterium]
MAELLYKELAYAIVGAAMEVHNQLGPGFLEVVYRKALVYELTLRGILVEEEKPLPVYYKGQLVGEYRADLVVDGKIILEIKAVSALIKAHEAQAIHYLTATDLRLALLINFGANSLQQKRIVKQ